MKFILSFILFIFLFIEIITDLHVGFFQNIWYIDIFSHFKAQILSLLLIITFLIGIALKLNKIKNINLYKKINILDFNNIILFLLLTTISFTLSPIFNSYSTIFNSHSNNLSNNFMYYQNIEGRKTEDDISEIYKQIEENKVKYISVVENSYEFNNYLMKKGWIRISGNNHTECSIYTNIANYSLITGKYSSKILNTESGYKICLATIDNINIFVVHPHPPINKEQFNRWKTFLSELNNIKNKYISDNKKILIIGDFNDTIYNSTFKQLFNDVYLKSYYSRHNKGLIGLILTLPIDQILTNMHKFDFYPVKYKSSDHRGFIITKEN